MNLYEWLTVLPPVLTATVAVTALVLDTFRREGNKEDQREGLAVIDQPLLVPERMEH